LIPAKNLIKSVHSASLSEALNPFFFDKYHRLSPHFSVYKNNYHVVERAEKHQPG
jgi:hypothetical protein